MGRIPPAQESATPTEALVAPGLRGPVAPSVELGQGAARPAPAARHRPEAPPAAWRSATPSLLFPGESSSAKSGPGQAVGTRGGRRRAGVNHPWSSPLPAATPRRAIARRSRPTPNFDRLRLRGAPCHATGLLPHPGRAPPLALREPWAHRRAPGRLPQEGLGPAEHHLRPGARRGLVLRMDRWRAQEPGRAELHDPLHAAPAREHLELGQRAPRRAPAGGGQAAQIGRASCRERVYVLV